MGDCDGDGDCARRSLCNVPAGLAARGPGRRSGESASSWTASDRAGAAPHLARRGRKSRRGFARLMGLGDGSFIRILEELGVHLDLLLETWNQRVPPASLGNLLIQSLKFILEGI